MLAKPAQVTRARDAESRMTQLYAAQRDGFQANPMPNAAERVTALRRLQGALVEHRLELADAVSADFGNRAIAETLFAEILVSVEGIKYARKRVRRWMKPSRRRVSLLMATTRASVLYQPLGVVGIVVPWNYPIFLAVGPLTYALAAGNRVMLKMSEFTPRTAAVFARLIEQNFPGDAVAVVTGGADLGAAFSRLPFDHLLFTGSTRVGREVMKAAADNLTPVTLELGGKSPAIIARDADIDVAAERICFGKTLNAGQTCVAPDYVLCPREQREQFVARFREVLARMYPTIGDNDDYTSIVDDRHYRRLQSLLEDAAARGARIVGLAPAGEDLEAASRKMPVSMILEVSDDMAVMQEEIFGPLLPIVAYDELCEAIAYVNAHPRPLALYLFTASQPPQQRILAETHAGGVCINDTVFHVACDDVPFGGIGPSGMGHYHGHEGFLTFSKPKGVFHRPRLNTARILYPPHGGVLQRWLFRLFVRK